MGPHFDDVAVRTDVDLVTVQARILTSLRAGNYLVDAAMEAGVSLSSLKKWIADAKVIAGTERPLTDDAESRLLSFAAAVHRAQAEWVVRTNAMLEVEQRGGVKVETTEETLDPETGEVLTRKRRVEYSRPDSALAMKRLARRHPAGFGPVVKVTGADGGPIEVSTRLAQLAETLAAEVAARATPEG